MNFLMLRGQVPQDRDPQEIVFDTLEEVDDVWTHLFYNLLDNGDHGELWYWAGDREKKFKNNFVERWVPSFDTYRSKFVPDVIFCRGGFPQYHSVLQRFPNAIKIYYGAGRRFLPQPGFDDYDIVLQDSVEQVKVCMSKFPKPLTTLFIKPAADNIFYPIECDKEYDVCFPANGVQSFKGHGFIYSTVPKDIKILNLGNNPHKLKYPSNVTSYRVLRPKMAENIAKCRIGIVVVENKIDSCPRVIPEMLACGIPIVVLDRVRFWSDKYIKSVADSSGQYATGEITNKKNFWEVIRHVLENVDLYSPRKYYSDNLSLKVAGQYIRRKIDERI